jgi:hypothetical protein
MSLKRKSTDLPVQVHPVPPVPSDYGTEGSPSPVVGFQYRIYPSDYTGDPLDENGVPIYFARAEHCSLTVKIDLLFSYNSTAETAPPNITECTNRPTFLEGISHTLSFSASRLQEASHSSASALSHHDRTLFLHPSLLPDIPTVDTISSASEEPNYQTTITHTESHPTGCTSWPSCQSLTSTALPSPRTRLHHRTQERYHE